VPEQPGLRGGVDRPSRTGAVAAGSPSIAAVRRSLSSPGAPASTSTRRRDRRRGARTPARAAGGPCGAPRCRSRRRAVGRAGVHRRRAAIERRRSVRGAEVDGHDPIGAEQLASRAAAVASEVTWTQAPRSTARRRLAPARRTSGCPIGVAEEPAVVHRHDRRESRRRRDVVGAVDEIDVGEPAVGQGWSERDHRCDATMPGSGRRRCPGRGDRNVGS
jgi:hypothetical protein